MSLTESLKSTLIMQGHDQALSDVFADAHVPAGRLLSLLCSGIVEVTPGRAQAWLEAFLSRFDNRNIGYWASKPVNAPVLPHQLDAQWPDSAGYENEHLVARLWCCIEVQPKLAETLRATVISQRWHGLLDRVMQQPLDWSGHSPWRIEQGRGSSKACWPWTHVFVKMQDPDLLKTWIQHPQAHPRELDEGGRSALFFADRQAKMVDLLIDAGVDPAHVARDGHTALARWATQRSYGEESQQARQRLEARMPQQVDNSMMIWNKACSTHPQPNLFKDPSPGVQAEHGGASIHWQPLGFMAVNMSIIWDDQVLKAWRTALTSLPVSALTYESIPGIPDGWLMEAALQDRHGSNNRSKDANIEDIRKIFAQQMNPGLSLNIHMC